MSRLPEELVDDLRAKFSRYSVEYPEGQRTINFSGFRYLLKSCPQESHIRDVSEERLEELFLSAAGPGSTKKAR
jgi:hypothetical protein